MVRNFFTVAFRNLLRHRTFSLINIIGLTLGIACALFIFLIVKFETSYDRYHAKADRIYRINSGSPKENEASYDTGSPHGLAPILRTEFPEIEYVTTIKKLSLGDTQIEVDHVLTRENELYYVDPQFFKLFDFTWKQGNPRTALQGPNKVVINESAAQRLFKGDALGKRIRLNNRHDLVVTGVIQDAPTNSDFPIALAVSHSTFEQMKDEYQRDNLGGWGSHYHTYVLLKEGADPTTLKLKFKKMVEHHMSKEAAEKVLAFSAMPLVDIHFTSGNFNERIISREKLQALRIIGLFILVIACINFTNLASAQSIRRAKEVGIRKTLGSSRKNLVLQFLGETFMITLASMILSFLIVNQLVLISKNITDIPLNVQGLQHVHTLYFLGVVLILVTLLSGFYPAFVLSGFRPVAALKGASVSIGLKGLFLRKGLIAFQFIISQVLIVCTLVVVKQTDHFNTVSLGFNKDAIITVDLPSSEPAKLSTLRNNLTQYPEIKNVSYSLNPPAAIINKWWTGFRHATSPDEDKLTEVKIIDSVFFKMFEIERLAGTIAIEGDDGTNIIVNENFVKEIGLSDPSTALGETVKYWGKTATIVGVVKDFQTVTLHEGMHAVLMTKSTDLFQKISVKIDRNQSTHAIGHLEKHWKEAFPEYYFTYAFLDDELATFYTEERKMSKLLVAFATVAVAIGCVGLLGLIMFVSAQRTKEIGIRKILGATIANIASLLSKDFIMLVFIAGVISWPIAYYLMHSWLAGFANKIDLFENAWIFILASLLAVVFALVTVGFQALKAAFANPTDSLRNE